MGLIVNAARKDVGASICRAQVQPVVKRRSRLFGDLKLDRTTRLVLDNRRPLSHTVAGSYVIDPKADEIATAQLAINGEVEHRQIAFATLDLKPDTNGPNLFRPKGALLANETALVPCDTGTIVGLDFGGHGRPPHPTAPTTSPSFTRPAILSQSH